MGVPMMSLSTSRLRGAGARPVRSVSGAAGELHRASPSACVRAVSGSAAADDDDSDCTAPDEIAKLCRAAATTAAAVLLLLLRLTTRPRLDPGAVICIGAYKRGSAPRATVLREELMGGSTSEGSTSVRSRRGRACAAGAAAAAAAADECCHRPLTRSLPLRPPPSRMASWSCAPVMPPTAAAAPGRRVLPSAAPGVRRSWRLALEAAASEGTPQTPHEGATPPLSSRRRSQSESGVRMLRSCARCSSDTRSRVAQICSRRRSRSSRRWRQKTRHERRISSVIILRKSLPRMTQISVLCDVTTTLYG